MPSPLLGTVKIFIFRRKLQNLCTSAILQIWHQILQRGLMWQHGVLFILHSGKNKGKHIGTLDQWLKLGGEVLYK